MKICDIRETALTVYRVLEASSVRGYALHPAKGLKSQPMVAVDPDIDHVGQLQVHVFGTKREADAFLEGLTVAGEDSVLSICEQCGDVWAVLREVRYEPDDEDGRTVRVITYSERPRVLITVRGGVAEPATDEPDLDLFRVDSDDEPDAVVPERFNRLLSEIDDS
jgi:hypothetical protein